MTVKYSNTYILVEFDPTISEMFIIILLNKVVGLVARLLEALDDDSDKNIQEKQGDQ